MRKYDFYIYTGALLVFLGSGLCCYAGIVSSEQWGGPLVDVCADTWIIQCLVMYAAIFCCATGLMLIILFVHLLVNRSLQMSLLTVIRALLIYSPLWKLVNKNI